MNPLLSCVALGLALHAQGTTFQRDRPPAITLQSEEPVYKLTLPVGYDHTVPSENPPRYVRSSGREAWARVSIVITPTAGPLPQNPAGITSEEILALVSPPPEAATTFGRRAWKSLEIGVIEYRADVNDLSVIGLSTILPLAKKGLRITVYAPDPLEKEVREDFEALIFTISNTETNWYSDEALRKIATMEKVSLAGGVLAALYPIVWVIFFRGQPLAAHWFRTGWLLLISLLLFIPVSSPGPVTVYNNLFVNVLVPLMYVMLTIRRLKFGIDAD